MAAVGPPSTTCSGYIGRSRGWRAFARHDVVATAASPTRYFDAYGVRARHPRPAMLLRKTWMAGPRLMGVKIGRRVRLAVPFVMAAVGPPSTTWSAYIGRSRGWRAFARHDVV